MSQANPEAARLAGKLRAAMKDQALRGPAIADEVERLTGVRPRFAAQWISRRLSGEKALLRVSPDLYVLAEIAGLDPVELVADAMAKQMEDAASWRTRLFQEERPWTESPVHESTQEGAA